MEEIIKTETTQNTPINQEDDVRINDQITNSQVRLITETGENVGIVSIREALLRAQEKDLDLVEIAKNGNMPICKVIDAGKYKYALQKKKAELKKGKKTTEVKEIKLSPNIGQNDYDIKLKSAKRFLTEGNKVKITLRFRGREMSYTNLGMAVVQRAESDLQEIGKTEHAAKLEGRQISMMIAPK